MILSRHAVDRLHQACDAVCRIKKTMGYSKSRIKPECGRQAVALIKEIARLCPDMTTFRIDRKDKPAFVDLTWKPKGEGYYFSPELIIRDPAIIKSYILKIWVDHKGTAHISSSIGYSCTISAITPLELLEWIVEFIEELN